MNYTVVLDILVVLCCIGCGWVTYLDLRMNKQVKTALEAHGDHLDEIASAGDEIKALVGSLRVRVLKLEGKVVAAVTGENTPAPTQAPAPGSDSHA